MRRLALAAALCISVVPVVGQNLLVANQRDVTVSLLDAVSGKTVGTIAENTSPVWGHELIASPDGKTAYLPIYGSTGVGKPGIDGHELLVIDIPSRRIAAHVDFGHGVRPHCIQYEPHSGLYFVTTEIDKTVSILDPKTRSIVGAIPTGAEQSHMLVLSHDGRLGYTANVGPGSVSVVDIKARKLLGVIPVAPMVQRIAISNDDRYVFTSNYQQPELVVIDTATRKIAKRIPLPGLGYGAAPTKDGKSLIIAIPSTNQVAVIDLANMKIERTVDVASFPQEVLVRPDGKVAYVSCAHAGKVTAIDTATWKPVATFSAGTFPDGLAWAQ